MTITADKVGRDLHLRLEGVDDPFVVHPLPGGAGVQITDTYLQSAAGAPVAMIDALQMALDGARQNAITGRWEPLPEEEQANFARINTELSQSESEAILMPAFFWQTILGMDGVKAYVEGGGGIEGTLKATGALSTRLGLFTRPTSPASA